MCFTTVCYKMEQQMPKNKNTNKKTLSVTNVQNAGSINKHYKLSKSCRSILKLHRHEVPGRKSCVETIKIFGRCKVWETPSRQQYSKANRQRNSWDSFWWITNCFPCLETCYSQPLLWTAKLIFLLWIDALVSVQETLDWNFSLCLMPVLSYLNNETLTY